MQNELDRLRNFSTEFSPNENKSNFFLGKIIAAATSSKNLQKKAISNQTSIADTQTEFYDNNLGVGEEVSKDYKDSHQSLKDVAAKYPDAYNLSATPPDYLKPLYAMIQKLRSTLSK